MTIYLFIKTRITTIISSEAVRNYKRNIWKSEISCKKKEKIEETNIIGGQTDKVSYRADI